MNHYRYLTGLFLLFCCFTCDITWAQLPAKDGFTDIRFSSTHTAFPERSRINGYTYGEKFFDAASHYSDSSVLMMVPDNLPKQKRVDLVFWFHGWNNNIDSAVVFYHLAQQFVGARHNAVLVLAETAKNTPDSYGGKLEQPQVFSGLVRDVVEALKKEKIASNRTLPGNIILAGHSGAYRVTAAVLQFGGIKVQEVDLFDALYGELGKFL